MKQVDGVGKGRFDSLTGMRALAALSVAICHSVNAWPHVGAVTLIGRFGYLGVDFFFCLSGFVMCWTWSGGARGADFLTRRFARLYPTIVLCLGASLLAWWLLHTPLGGYVGPLRSIGDNLLVIQSWFFDSPSTRQSWDGVTWSLSCEFFFYACSPLILPRIVQLKGKTCVALMVFVFSGDALLQILSDPVTGSTAQNVFYFFPPARLFEYVLGALACRLIILGPPIRFRSIWIGFLLTSVAPLILYCRLVPPAHQYLTVTSLVVVPGFIVTIMLAASRDRVFRRKWNVLRTRQMVWLGDVSFSYYMVHVLVLGVVALIYNHYKIVTTSEWIGSLWLIGYLLITLLIASTVWRLVERPGQRGILLLFDRLSQLPRRNPHLKKSGSARAIPRPRQRRNRAGSGPAATAGG
jgi:peptidoglycan/LPS O-acetylase OafA/YrhL